MVARSMARETAPKPGADAVNEQDAQEELAALRRELEAERDRTAEALAQQAATGQILRVLGASSGDAQPVFNAIVEEAVRVCGAVGATLSRVDRGELVGLAVHAA